MCQEAALPRRTRTSRPRRSRERARHVGICCVRVAGHDRVNAIAVAFLLRRRFFWGVLTLVFAAILDFGRVAAGFHYPTDVLAGAAIGALAAVLLCAPPLRRRIDALSDFIGGLWDRVIDAVLKRVLPGGMAHSR